MNGYICFYKNKRIEIYANTTYEAQLEAARKLNVRRSSEISVHLAERDGEQVTHSTQHI